MFCFTKIWGGKGGREAWPPHPSAVVQLDTQLSFIKWKVSFVIEEVCNSFIKWEVSFVAGKVCNI